MPQIAVDEIEAVAARALEAHGASAEVAATMAGVVAWAEARGNRICGLYYLESYCQQLRSGRIDRDAAPVVEARRPGAIHVDAANGFAQPALLAGLPVAARAAREFGTASLSMGRMHTGTALGWFTEAAAREGLIGLGMTNASPIVSPPGGRGRVIGTNPIAFAVPDGAGDVAWAFDQATTQVALGQVTMAQAAGRAIPEGWGVGADGAPTTDPAAVTGGGALASAGGAKGWGIGLMVEIMAAGMGGGRLSRDVAPLKAEGGDPHDLSLFVLLVDPSTSPAFGARLEALMEGVETAGGRMPGRGRVPAETVEVPGALWEGTLALAG